MPAEVELEFVLGLRSYERLLDGKPEMRASVCTGTDVAKKCLQKMRDVFETRYNVQLQFQTQLLCEKKPLKRLFLHSQFDVEFMSTEAGDLANSRAFNDRTNDDDIVPYFDVLDAGVVCTSRTPQSSKCKENANCVQEGRSETGESYAKAETAIVARLGCSST